MRKNKLNLDNILKSLGDALIITNIDGNITLINPAAENLIGQSSNNVIGKSLISVLYLINPSTRERYNNIVEQVISYGKIIWQSYETDMVTNKNGVFPISGSANAIIGDKNNIEGIIILLHKSEEHKQVEKALYESEIRFSTMFRSNPIPVGITRASDFKIIDVNDAWSLLTGYSHDEAINHTSTELGLAKTSTLSHVKEILYNHGFIHQQEITLYTRTGQERLVQISSELIEIAGEAYVLNNLLDITERKLAEEKLSESEQKYRTLFSSMEQGFCIIEIIESEKDKPVDFKYILANPAFERHTGLHNVIGKTILELVPNSEKTIIDIYETVAKTGRHDNFEAYISDLGFWIDAEVFPTEKPGQIAVLFTNITERKQAEALLKQRETLLREVGKIAKVGGWELDTNTMKQIWTDETYAIHDREQGVYNPNSSLELSKFEPGSKELIEKAFNEAVSMGKPYDLELEMTTVLGNKKWVRAVCLPLLEEGKVTKLTGTIQDITKRKQAEKMLKASEAKFKAVFENAPVGISLIDSQRNLLESNSLLAQIVQMEESDLESGKYQKRKYIREDKSEIPKNELASARAIDEHRAIHNVVNGIVLENGEIIWTQVSAAPLGLDDPRFVVITQDITERKLAEEKLINKNKEYEELNKKLLEANLKLSVAKETAEESEKDLKEAQEIAKLGSWKFDLKTGEVKWSKNYYKLVEMDSSQPPLSLEEIKKLVHPDDQNLFENKLNEITRTNKAETIYFRLVINGKIKWIQSNLVPQFENGKLVKISGVSIDITDIKKAETDLKNSELKFRSIAENLSDVIAITDNYGNIIYISPSSLKMFGYNSQEMTGKFFGDFLVPNERPKLFTIIEENIDKSISNRNQLLKALHRDGNSFYAELSTSSIIEDEGIKGRLSLIRDVTELRLSKIRERNRSLILQMLTENNTLEEILYQIQKSIEEEEPESICTILLVDKSGKHLHSCIPNQLPDFFNQAVDGLKIGMGVGSCGTAAFTKQTVIVEDVLSHTYWEPFRELAKKAQIGACWSQPIVSASDQVLGTFAIYYKKTKLPNPIEIARIDYAASLARLAIEKKTSEKELYNYKEHLEELVNLRTIELKAANKELESFSYSVSHDLRAPLRAVGGFTQILLENYGSQLDEEGIRICNVIKSGSEKMGQLIDDLLAFSRLGRAGINPTVINMEILVKNIIEEFTLVDSQKKIHFTLKPLPEIKADATLIKQVWINLISNAIKYSSKKEQTIIEISSIMGDNEATFVVKDNGSGFKMQYVDKLFGVFQRLHKESEFEGTGIGLAIVKRIITRHGGQVWAKSEINEGAEFYFTLPK